MKLTPREINSTITIPEWDTASPVKSEEAAFIYEFILKNSIKRTLETGFAFAKSASHIIAATNSMHIAIDPFQSNYDHLGLKNLKSLGLDALIDFRADFSHNVLPKLHSENRKFEFIFIDGDHKFDGELVDFYYADLLLEEDGYVLLHDTWMRSTALLMKFIKTNRKDYTQIETPLRNFALYQKTGKDNRNGMFFKEFFTTKSLITHYSILWMSSGKQTFVKKAAQSLKRKIKKVTSQESSVTNAD